MWRTSDILLEKAIRHFRLQNPVYIRQTNGKRRNGCYHGMFVGTDLRKTLPPTVHHKITISSRLDPAAASRALWHELCHAAQREREPMMGLRYMQQSRMVGYHNNPYERQAFDAEKNHKEIGSLTAKK